MNCRRVQKLLPLYIEGDLGSEQMSRIAEHVEWCGQCNWIADEYRESQSWIRGASALEFDEGSLDRMKAGVLSEISAQPKNAPILSSLSSFAERWTRRNVAFAITAIIVFLAGFYVYRAVQRPAAAPQFQANDEKPQSTHEQNAVKPNVTAPDPGIRPVNHPKRRRISSADTARFSTSKRTETFARTAEPAPALDSKDMLRIEMQTADPMIRIIWFAPKESENHQPKPATD